MQLVQELSKSLDDHEVVALEAKEIGVLVGYVCGGRNEVC